LETIGNDPRIMELLGDEAYDELINLIEGIWVLDTQHCMLTE
jgi:hypothetical protein